jgi:glycerol uptake facilitator protein
MKKYIAEFFGTFVLTITVLGSLSVVDGQIPTALLAGAVLGLFVYSIGKISGTHINPAVTLGLWSLKKFKSQDVFFYILAQFAGAALAVIIGKYLGVLSGVDGIYSPQALIGEIIGALIFTFGIASAVFAKETDSDAHFAPLVIGGSLTLGASVAAFLGSNGVLNPAVAFGINSFGIAYIIGPVIGSILGMWLYKSIAINK